MRDFKKYTDVVRLGHKSTEGVLQPGDFITITEKVDGANVSFIYDSETDTVKCYSRNTELSEGNTLRGYYGWIQENIYPIRFKLNPNYRYYGEWLVSHTIQYTSESYSNFYMFNVWDEINQEYLSDTIMRNEAARLNLKTVALFYEGEYISFEHLLSFVGKSELGAEIGEGIVVKNVSYKDRYGRQMFVKLVSDKMRETQKQKAPKNPNISSQEKDMIKFALTTARVEKLIHKLIDEDQLNKDDIYIENMGNLLKLLGNKVLEDIIKEEIENAKQYEETELKKATGKLLPPVLREVINNFNQ